MSPLIQPEHLTLEAPWLDVPSDRRPLLSVVAPMFNEEGSVPVFCERVCAVLDQMGERYEVLLVDDGSSDATWQVITAAAQRFPQVRGLKLARNFGHQPALLAGLADARGQAVISMDGDLQHPPELIPQMVQAWKEGAAVVSTQRIYNAQASAFKKWTSSAYYKVFGYLAGFEMADGSSDFRLMDQSALRYLLTFRPGELFLRGIVSWLDFPTKTLTFQAGDRLHGESKYTLKKMLKLARAGIVTFSVKPLKLAITMGVMTSLFAFAFLGYVVLQYYRHNTIAGWASTLGVISLLFGVLFILLGIVGSYLGRIYIMMQNRPAFIIHHRTPGP